MLDIRDNTPADFQFPKPGAVETLIKRPVRRFGYPVYNLLIDRWLRSRYERGLSFGVDRWLWGQRGNDYSAHRRRVNRVIPLQGKRLLIAGCGLGYDVPSWIGYRLSEIVGVDYFNYDRAWKAIKDQWGSKHPDVCVRFQQESLEDLRSFPHESFDLVASDAVFEHLRNPELVLREFHRILKPGGVIYATYGALWYCWKGDHISGFDALENGYNHLILDADAYQKYVAGLGQYQHTPHDGRTWIQNQMFSYLRPSEYLDLLNKIGFRKRYTAVIIDPRAVQCLDTYPHLRDLLLKKCDYLDLIITGMTIIQTKD